MSARPNSLNAPVLRSAEGELVAVRISVEPRLLESLLEALAKLPFPVNPQIFHHSTVVYLLPDGRKESYPAAVVEFPAYSDRLEEVSRLLRGSGFDPRQMRATSMLQEIQASFS